MTPRTIDVETLRVDGGTQARVAIDPEYVAELADVLADPDVDLPPVDAYDDGTALWLADGFHRRAAYALAGRERIPATVHGGTLEDARWAALGANTRHGLRRTNEDKARAVRLALSHPRGAGLSDRQIALHCGVHHSTVAAHRAEMQAGGEIRHLETRTGRDGKQYPTAPARPPEPARCANCGGSEWGEDDEGPFCVACLHPQGEPADAPTRRPHAQPQPTAEPAPAPPAERRKAAAADLERLARMATTDLWHEAQALAERIGHLDHERMHVLKSQLEAVGSTIRAAKPSHECPKCAGAGCRFCDGDGWVNMVEYRSLVGSPAPSPAGPAHSLRAEPAEHIDGSPIPCYDTGMSARPPITEQLRQAVRDCGQSQRAVALAAGIDPATLCRFLAGQRGLSMEALDSLGEYLDLQLVRRGKKGR